MQISEPGLSGPKGLLIAFSLGKLNLEICISISKKGKDVSYPLPSPSSSFNAA